MAPLEQKSKKQITNHIQKAILKVLDSPELDELTEEQIEAIAKSFYIDSMKEQFSKEIQKAKLDKEKLDSYTEQWLSGFQSKHTIRSFRYNLSIFLEWLNGKSIIEVDALIADQYMSFLNSDKKLSPNTKRQRIGACSSFFTACERWQLIDHNPFKGTKGLPKKSVASKDAESIPSNEELDTIEDYALKQILKSGKKSETKGLSKTAISKMKAGNTLAYCALRILRKYGLRVGALNTLKIDKAGNYKGKSKGNEIEGRFDSETLAMLNTHGLNTKTPFQNYSEGAFSMWLWRAQSSYELKAELKTKFSPHSIRHRFAIDFYHETKDVHELQMRLGHSSLLVTTAYLAGLKGFDTT